MKRMKVAYVLDSFPVLSETFIVREIFELRRNNLVVPVFALADTSSSARNKVVHPESQVLRKEVIYSSEMRDRFSKLQQAFLHLMFFCMKPSTYFHFFRLCKGHSSRVFHLFRRSVLYARLFKEEQIQHIHVHFSLQSCSLAMMISAWTDIPFSFTVHAHDIFISELAELMEEKIKRARFIVCISQYNKDYLVRKYPWIKEDKIRVVHCGIDINEFTPGKKIRNKLLKILSVGRLHEQKGFEYLIRACELLKKESELDFTCDIIGDGKEQTSLKEMISRAELTREVRLLGAKTQGGVLNAMKKADVFVLPCIAAANGAMDGIPVVLMEAMSLRLPVISTMISGIPELVRNGAGLLVEPGNVKELASAIEKFAVLDDDEREVAGRRGRSIIEKEFNLKREVGKLAELFGGSWRKL